nr:hypothetical protein [Rickettsia endosymbiont of Ceutorhynchus assimilis]
MTNQNNQLTPKPILFLQPPYNQASQKLMADITIICEKKGLGILKTIKSKGPYDDFSYCELISRVRNWPAKPVTVIIDLFMLHTPINIVFWGVLGTLRISNLITVIAYRKIGDDVILRTLNKHETRFIRDATAYAKTYEMFEWKKFI